ncbi:hypothetical protein GCM10010345_42400 [Streptomyces canarius]|uniref:SDR family oxidoreductase n=1 Tax=Streptomyces canarius TaxID=285453 RepID=A0ABQ3CPP3_9ACTN|nr:hypothetical protein GCM10010345_42400 [Streptomyces canarius]
MRPAGGDELPVVDEVLAPARQLGPRRRATSPSPPRTARCRRGRPALPVLYAQTPAEEGFKVNALAPGLRASDLTPGAAAAGGDPAEAARGALRLALPPDDGPHRWLLPLGRNEIPRLRAWLIACVVRT